MHHINNLKQRNYVWVFFKERKKEKKYVYIFMKNISYMF